MIMEDITLFRMICREAVLATISNNTKCPATEEPNWKQLSPVVLVTIHFQEEVPMKMDIKTWIIRLITIRPDIWEAPPTRNKMYKRLAMDWSSSKIRWIISEVERALATLNLPIGRDLIHLDSAVIAKTKVWITWAATINIPTGDPINSRRINHQWCHLLQVKQTLWTIQTWIQWTRQLSQDKMDALRKINRQTTGVHSSLICHPQIVIQEANSKRTQLIICKVWKYLSKKAHTSLRRGLQWCAGMSVIATNKIAESSLLSITPIVEDLAIRINSTSSMTTWMQIHLVSRRRQE